MCNVGPSLKRCNQLAIFAIQPADRGTVAVWLVEDGVHPVRLFPSFNLVPFERWWHPRGTGYCRGKTGRAQQHFIE